jgi:plasmid replication initiation protein
LSNDHLIVVKDNKIIEASYTLSLSEQRVLLACISQIDFRNSLQPENKFHVVASDIVDLMGFNRSNAYRDMKMAVDKLYNRSIKIDPRKRSLATDKHGFTRINNCLHQFFVTPFG